MTHVKDVQLHDGVSFPLSLYCVTHVFEMFIFGVCCSISRMFQTHPNVVTRLAQIPGLVIVIVIRWVLALLLLSTFAGKFWVNMLTSLSI